MHGQIPVLLEGVIVRVQLVYVVCVASVGLLAKAVRNQLLLIVRQLLVGFLANTDWYLVR